MIIRSSQMQEFSERKADEFQTFMMGFLREEFPEDSADLTDAQLRAGIERHVLQARNYAIEDENSMAKFITLKWMLGEDFEEFADRPWLMGLLEDRARPAMERMDIALEAVDRQLDETDE